MARKANPEIDIALEALCINSFPGQTMTAKDIAEACNCSCRLIQSLEESAIEKLKRIAPGHCLHDFINPEYKETPCQH